MYLNRQLGTNDFFWSISASHCVHSLLSPVESCIYVLWVVLGSGYTIQQEEGESEHNDWLARCGRPAAGPVQDGVTFH